MTLSRSNPRAKRRWAVLALVVAALTLALAASSLAVHTLFELGGNQSADILGDGVTANGPDWADIFNADGTAVGLGTFGGAAAGFIKDDLAQKGLTDDTTFSGAGGSNKNNDPISAADCAARTPPLTGSACDTWHWDGGNVPAKDDLSNVYAFAKFNAADQLILYVGLERLAPEGDSHIDVEFLQDAVSLVDGQIVGDLGIPCNDPGNDPTPCNFAGVRTIEDLIVSMDYVQGGGIGEVSVRDWNGSAYVQVGLAGGEGCNAADTICAFNNGGDINGGPWDNFDRGNAVIANLPQNAFTEIGINVTALLGDTPCISTIMAKTRSSASFTAELKDFAGPSSFPICGAQISIGDSAVNEVGVAHTFTVTVEQKLGQLTSPAPDGTDVDVILTAANGAVLEISANTCDTDLDDPATGDPGVGTVGGECTVTFTSDSAGTVTGSATATLTVGGEARTVTTDGTGTNSGPAVKRFVDARITIGPNDTNGIFENHTFTVNVAQNDGLPAADAAGDGVTGFGPAPDGTAVTVALTDSGGAANSISSNTCASPGTASGACSVTFTSNTAGTVTGNASVTFLVGGESLTRDTDSATTLIGSGPGGSGAATKIFHDGSLAWLKHDNAGVLQGGATFTVCRTHNFDSAVPGTPIDITPDVCVNVVDDVVGPGVETPTTSKDQDPDAGEFLLTGLRLGTYTVVELTAPSGFEKDPDTVTVNLTIANQDVTITTAFVNNRPIVKITADGYTNAATGTPLSGVVSGTTTYTFKVKNYGLAATSLTNSSFAVTLTSGGTGTLVCSSGGTELATNTLVLNGTTLAAGEEKTLPTVTCIYSGLADGATVTATLTVNYTTNGLQRAASGSQAVISFKAQSD